MASAGLDQSLDQIMQSRPKNRRGASGRRASAPAATGNQNARQRYSTTVPGSKHGSPAAKPASAAPGAQAIAQKIMVSGLPPDVNEEQIKELFQSTVGSLSSVQLNFDSQGRSKGTATVIFQKKGDANKAFEQYNNRLIDGKRPMKIEIVMDPTKVPPPSLASRVAPAPAEKKQPAQKAAASSAAPERAGKPAGGRGRGRRRKGGNDRPAKSVADLDAEMEVYKATPDEAAA
ncbi:RNA recognition motif protein [Ceratobasidium sp. AG-Ba]|nr:RNA recognition motif protein [Ceratobasidium sp. AG-Ba]